MKRIRRKIEDARVLGLIQAYLSCTVMDDHICSQKTKGVLQGGPLSPLLSNIYLDDLDKYMEEKGYHFAGLVMILMCTVQSRNRHLNSFRM